MILVGMGPVVPRRAQLAFGIPFPMAAHAIELQNRLNIANKIDLFPLLKRKIFRPRCTLFDPGFQGQLLVGREAIPFRRHRFVMFGRQSGRGIEGRFRGIFLDQSRSFFATLERTGFGQELETAFRFFGAMTGKTAHFQDRTDFALEINVLCEARHRGAQPTAYSHQRAGDRDRWDSDKHSHHLKLKSNERDSTYACLYS